MNIFFLMKFVDFDEFLWGGVYTYVEKKACSVWWVEGGYVVY